jgi:hypothetical protein
MGFFLNENAAARISPDTQHQEKCSKTLEISQPPTNGSAVTMHRRCYNVSTYYFWYDDGTQVTIRTLFRSWHS